MCQHFSGYNAEKITVQYCTVGNENYKIENNQQTTKRINQGTDDNWQRPASLCVLGNILDIDYRFFNPVLNFQIHSRLTKTENENVNTSKIIIQSKYLTQVIFLF